jgi:hypothetical protein
MSRETAARRSKARRKAARLACAEPGAGHLPNHDERRRQAVTRSGKQAPRRGHPEIRHLVIAILSAVAVMAVTGAALGLIPAIRAAGGNGTVGTFIVSSQPCLPHRGGCAYTGTFEARSGNVVSHVDYVGTLPAGSAAGSGIPARYAGYQQAYPLRGSRTWATDLVFMLLIGGVLGFLVWLLPVGLGQRRTGIEL